VANILQTFVEHEDGKLLSEFFSFLDVDGVIDSYLAGYFEKVLEMLLRYTTGPVIQYLNDGGIPTFSQFLKHVDNYSIMQLIQRIMLPHIPFSICNDDIGGPSNKEESQCNWAFLEETCELLCIQMIESENTDVPSHISDLFITVLQLSPSNAPILGHICKKACLDRILMAAFYDNADTPNIFDPPSSRACVSLAALSVVESTLSRLCETASILTVDGGDEMVDNETIVRLRESTENLCSTIQEYFGDIAKQLECYAVDKPCGELTAQSKRPVSRLGHRGLQLVKLVESLVRLGHADLDVKLCESNVLKNTLELIFVYESNSMLHLSIQRIVLMVIESESSRSALQKYLFVESGLLKRVMEEIRKQYPSISSGDTGPVNAVSHPPSLGHFLNITQAIHHTLVNSKVSEIVNEMNDEEEQQAAAGGDESTNSDAQDASATKSEESSGGGDSDKQAEGAAETESETPTAAADTAATEAQSADENLHSTDTQHSLVTMMQDVEISADWESFVEEILRPLEMRSTLDDSEDYDDKDALAQAEMDYAMQALGIKSPSDNQEGDSASWMESDQFHFDEAHDADEDDDDEKDNRGAYADTAEEGDSSDAHNDDFAVAEENFADFTQMEEPIAAAVADAAAAPATEADSASLATFDASFDTDFTDFPTDTSENNASTEETGSSSSASGEEFFAKSTPDPFVEINEEG
jgi:hypothetical protein